MKKLTGLKVIIGSLLLTILIVVPVRGYAGWVLYDDFESGIINESLWDGYGDWMSPNAERYIEDGKLKIILDIDDPILPASRYGLIFKKYVEEIKAIRAKITIGSCTGDGRAKIKTDWPLDDSDYSYQQGIHIFCSEERENKFIGYLSLYETDPPHSDIWYSPLEFTPPGDIIGETFVVTVWFLPDKAKFRVSEHGSIRYTHNEGFTSSEGRYYVIAVQSSSGEGTCTVYYDDIEVFIEKKKKQK